VFWYFVPKNKHPPTGGLRMFFEHPRNGKEIKDFYHFGSGKNEKKNMPQNL